jgi:hypothetical protein
MVMPSSSDAIIELLYRSPASAEHRAKVAFELLRLTNWQDELVNDLMSEYSTCFPALDRVSILRERLSHMRDRHPASKEGSVYHLAWGMLPNDDKLHGYLAEFYFEWAEDLGIPEEHACAAIEDVIGK